MPIAQCNNIEVCYDTVGDRSDRPLVLIMGLSRQMIHWGQGLCDRLAAGGHYLVRFDNRDMGKSATFDHAGVPDLVAVLRANAAGQRPDVPYTLSDMAADVVGLMDALGIPGAHLLGVSLGGMVAQTVAIEHPDRALTLTSIMSTTGRPGLPGPSPEGARVFSTPHPRERAAFVEHAVGNNRFLNGPHMPFDEMACRRTAALAFERGVSSRATVRQLAAMMASGSRHEQLAELKLPALVVHGTADELINVAGGRDTAACIPGARYLEIPGMAHLIAEPTWDRSLTPSQS